jgi:hypothetical protein
VVLKATRELLDLKK